MSTPEFDNAAHMAGAYRLNDIVRSQLDWLWPNRIPLGRLTLLVSDPGLGKSLLALDVAARVTRADPWPDAVVENQAADSSWRKSSVEGQHVESGSPHSSLELRAPSGPQLSTLNRQPSSVLILTAEDDLHDTVLPRLEALGADIAKVVAIPAVYSHQFRILGAQIPDGDHKLPPMIRTFDLWQDVSRLNLMISAMRDCRLVVIDPISAYLGATGEHGNRAVRNLLLQLAALARYQNVAVLAISHLRKKAGAAVHRTMGSLAFVAAARAAWVVTRDPECGERRLLMPLKNNLAPDVSGLAFTIDSHPASDQPILRWSPDPIATSAEAVIGNARPKGRPDAERQDAIDWIRITLSSGPRPSNEIKEEADAHGIHERTLRRAFREVRGEAFKTGSLAHIQWMWKLPTTGQQRSSTTEPVEGAADADFPRPHHPQPSTT